jgi:hypothetical protein
MKGGEQMKRNLRKKLCAAVFFCAFACGISAAPVLAITVSGVVTTINKSGDELTESGATVRLFNRNGDEIAQTISGAPDGSFSITVEGEDELLDVYFLTTKANFVDTYTQFFSFSEDEDEFEAPLLPSEETKDVIDSVAGTTPVIETMGIIAGGVELLADDDFSSVAGVKVKVTEYNGDPRPCNVLYLDLDEEDEPFWNPELTETSETGVFALYNIDIPPLGYRGVLLVLENADPKYFFNRTDTIVFPYKAGVESPEKISIANVIGWEPGAGEDIPIDDGGGGGGGCFVSGVAP